jgi:hypothetical protein
LSFVTASEGLGKHEKIESPAGQHTAVDGLRLKAWFLPV